MAPKETPLRRWLHARGISVEKFARMCNMSFNTFALVSRGKQPSDNVKVKIYWATLNYERENGEKKPKGILPAEWFDLDTPPPLPAPVAEPAPTPGKRRAPVSAPTKKGARKGR